MLLWFSPRSWRSPTSIDKYCTKSSSVVSERAFEALEVFEVGFSECFFDAPDVIVGVKGCAFFVAVFYRSEPMLIGHLTFHTDEPFKLSNNFHEVRLCRDNRVDRLICRGAFIQHVDVLTTFNTCGRFDMVL